MVPINVRSKDPPEILSVAHESQMVCLGQYRVSTRLALASKQQGPFMLWATRGRLEDLGPLRVHPSK